MSCSRVFVVEPTRLDISSASMFGPIVTLFRHGRYRPSVWEPAFGEAVVARLREEGFVPDRDYVVMTGQQLALVVATAAIVAAFGKFQALAFNAHSCVRDYEAITMGDHHETRSEVGVR